MHVFEVPHGDNKSLFFYIIFDKMKYQISENENIDKTTRPRAVVVIISFMEIPHHVTLLNIKESFHVLLTNRDY